MGEHPRARSEQTEQKQRSADDRDRAALRSHGAEGLCAQPLRASAPPMISISSFVIAA
jgi:hypothetical protein